MHGELQDTSVATLCRRIAAEGRTGTLTVSGLDGPGHVRFVDGQIVTARSPVAGARLGDRMVGAGFLSEQTLDQILDEQQRLDGPVRLGALLLQRSLVPRDAIRLFLQEQTLEALLELIRWRFGGYRFDDQDRVAERDTDGVRVAMSVHDVLLVVGQRQREWMELSRVIPDLAAVPAFTAHSRTVSASLEPDEFAVMASVDGERDLHQLARDLGYHEFELARIIYGLTQLGVVEVALPEDEVGAALDAALRTPLDTPPTPQPTAEFDASQKTPTLHARPPAPETPPVRPSDVPRRPAVRPITPSDPSTPPTDVSTTRGRSAAGDQPQPQAQADMDATRDTDAAREADATQDRDTAREADATRGADAAREADATHHADATPEAAAARQPGVEREAESHTEPSTDPEPAAEPDAATQPEAASPPEATTQPEPTTQHERTPQPEPTIRHERTPQPEPTPGPPAQPEPAPRAEPVARTEQGPGPAEPQHPTDRPAPTPDPGPAEPQHPTARPAPTPAAPPIGDEPTAPPTPASTSSGSDADVSEFLRELSRLAEDDGDDPPSPRPRRTSTPSDDDKPRRRGLFGRG